MKGTAGVGKKKKLLLTDGEVLMGTCPKEPVHAVVDWM